VDKDVGRVVVGTNEPESLARLEPPNSACHIVVSMGLNLMD
jgi:hypothetical protein